MPTPREVHLGNWAALGPVVRDARARAALTQRDLSSRAGVSRGWLIRFEAGLPNAEPVAVLKLLRALDLDLVVRPRGDVGHPGGEMADEVDLDDFIDNDLDLTGEGSQ